MTGRRDGAASAAAGQTPPTASAAACIREVFAHRLMEWQQTGGRHDLPWQGTHDPYRIWVSEIMLQQTQVATVMAYYPRFLQRFPDVHALAMAGEADVMALWSGLGYYSRARHLHRCAQIVCADFGGHFPATAHQLEQLPGIGPSTAAAIAAFSQGERVSILDANVQRVLARVTGYGGDLTRQESIRHLREEAAALLPHPGTHRQMVAYIQGLMDLGATICKPRNPLCEGCPMQDLCVARRENRVADLPVKIRKLRRSVQHWWPVMVWSPVAGLWLEQRPHDGIWPGLYCPPLLPSEEEGTHWCQHHGVNEYIRGQRHYPVVKHVLTHRDLYLHPVWIEVDAPTSWAPAVAPGRWVSHWESIGLPAPVRTWLQQHATQQSP